MFSNPIEVVYICTKFHTISINITDFRSRGRKLKKKLHIGLEI